VSSSSTIRMRRGVGTVFMPQQARNGHTAAPRSDVVAEPLV
jgi:hypothetical protein